MSNRKSTLLQALPAYLRPCLALAACVSGAAHAQLNSQVIRPVLGLTAAYDSNVLGLPDAEASLATTGSRSLSDTSRTLYAGLIVERLVGRQFISANASATSTRFDRLRQLDHEGHNVNLNWAWRVGDDWDGTLGVVHVTSLSPFTDFHALARNTNTTSRRFASAAYRINPDWRVRAAASRFAIDYSLPLQSRFNRRESQGELGVDYVTHSGNTIGLQWRRADGRLPNQVLSALEATRAVSEYRQDQAEIKASWAFTGKSTLNLLASKVSRTHRLDPARDFNGWNGRMTASMSVTGDTWISGAVWRETGIFDDVSTAYSTNRGASLAARWIASSKVTVEGSVRRERRDFTRSYLSEAAPQYNDTLRTTQLSMTYLPVARLNLQLSLFDSAKLTSGGAGAYSRHGASLSTRYQF